MARQGKSRFRALQRFVADGPVLQKPLDHLLSRHHAQRADEPGQAKDQHNKAHRQRQQRLSAPLSRCGGGRSARLG
jgi:hypothetical protein